MKLIIFLTVLIAILIHTTKSTGGLQSCVGNLLSTEDDDNILSFPDTLTLEERDMLLKNIHLVNKILKSNGTLKLDFKHRPLDGEARAARLEERERRKRLGKRPRGQLKFSPTGEASPHGADGDGETDKTNVLDWETQYPIVKPTYDDEDKYVAGLYDFYQKYQIKLCYRMPCSCADGVRDIQIPLGSDATGDFRQCFRSRIGSIKNRCKGSRCLFAASKAEGMVEHCARYTRGAVFWNTLNSDDDMKYMSTSSKDEFNMIYDELHRCSCEMIQPGYCGTAVSRTKQFKTFVYENSAMTQRFVTVSIGFQDLECATTTTYETWCKTINGLWVKLSRALSQVSVSKLDDTVCGVNTSFQIFCGKYNGAATVFTQLPGALKNIAVEKVGHYWGVNSSNQIFKSKSCLTLSCDWTLQNPELLLTQISVDESGHVFGVDTSYYYHYRRTSDATFTRMTDLRVRQVAVSGNTICAVDTVLSCSDTYNVYCKYGTFGTGSWVFGTSHVGYVDVSLGGKIVSTYYTKALRNSEFQ